MEKPVRRIAVAGYFGFANIGDEAVLTAFLKSVKDDGLFEPVVFSANPQLTAKQYDCQSVDRMNLKAVKECLKISEALVFPGGSILQDTTSLKSLLYYLYIIRLGKRCCKKVVLLGQGIGPLRRGLSRFITAKTLNRTNLITLRDVDSLQLLRSINVKTKTQLTADLSWLLQPNTTEAETILNQTGIAKNSPMVIIAPRPVKSEYAEQYLLALSDCINKLHQAGYIPAILPMQNEVDTQFASELKTKNSNCVVLPFIDSPETNLGIVCKAKAMIAVRFHALLFAGLSNIPAIAINYDPKVKSLAEILNAPTVNLNENCVNSLSLRWEETTALITQSHKNKENLKQSEQIQLAASNMDCLWDILKTP